MLSAGHHSFDIRSCWTDDCSYLGYKTLELSYNSSYGQGSQKKSRINGFRDLVSTVLIFNDFSNS